MGIIYLARHATPRWDMPEIPYHIPPGPPLSDMGNAEAIELARFFSRQNIGYCLSSPLIRAYKTAQFTAELCEVPLEIRTGLHEKEPEETYEMEQTRLLPILAEAFRLSDIYGPVVLFTHGSPIVCMLKESGLSREARLAHCWFDHKNAVSTAGAWRLEKTNENTIRIQMVFSPTTQGKPKAAGKIYP